MIVSGIAQLYLGVPGGFVTALIVGLVLLALIAAEWKAHGVGRFLILRILTATLIWLFAIQPKWQIEEARELPGRLAVLVDGSRSMNVRERAEQTRAALDAIPETADVDLFSFSDELAPLDPEDWQPRGAESRLAHALEMLDPAAQEIGAVLVLSDGAGMENIEPPPGVRVYVHPIGEPGLRDDAIADLEVAPAAFLRQPVRVRVRVHAESRPFSGAVSIHQGGALISETRVDVPAGEERDAVVAFVPRRLGRSVYTISIPTATDDEIPENNERSFLIDVRRERLRVLFVAGRPSWDVRFLRAHLKQENSIDLISFFILRTNSDLTMADDADLALIPFPTDELFREHLGSFDLVIFQDFDFEQYRMRSYLPRIRDHVRTGGAFAMVGGNHSFSAGAYAGTAIEEMLPHQLMPNEPEPRDSVRLGRFLARPNEANLRHPLLELRAGESSISETRSRWAELAELDGINRVAGIREGSQVLLEHPESDEAVVAVRRFGEGRVLSVMTDTTWRWGSVTGGVTGDASAYPRFWDRAIRWLTKDPLLEPSRVTTTRARYVAGGVIEARAQLRDEHYAPRTGTVRWQIRRGDEVLLEREGVSDAEGLSEIELPVPAITGPLSVAVVRDGPEGENRVLAEEVILVEGAGDELANPHVQHQVLSHLAEASEGDVLSAIPADLGSLDARRREAPRVEERAPLGHPLAVLFLLAALSFEWWARRRARLR